VSELVKKHSGRHNFRSLLSPEPSAQAHPFETLADDYIEYDLIMLSLHTLRVPKIPPRVCSRSINFPCGVPPQIAGQGLMKAN
jgi:hypothetical protein